MKLLSSAMTTRLPGNRYMVSQAPSGMPITAAIATADKLTSRDSSTISTRSSSASATIRIAVAAASENCAIYVLIYINTEIMDYIFRKIRKYICISLPIY